MRSSAPRRTRAIRTGHETASGWKGGVAVGMVPQGDRPLLNIENRHSQSN